MRTLSQNVSGSETWSLFVVEAERAVKFTIGRDALKVLAGSGGVVRWSHGSGKWWRHKRARCEQSRPNGFGMDGK